MTHRNGNAPHPAPPWHQYPFEPRVREALFAVEQKADQARDEVADVGAAIVRLELRERERALRDDRVEAALTVIAKHVIPEHEQEMRNLADRLRREREARLKLAARLDATASLAEQAKDEAVTATGRQRAVTDAELVELRGWRKWVVDKLWSFLAGLLLAFIAGALGYWLKK